MSLDRISTLQRAILAQIQPLTGTRATGSATVTAEGADVTVPRNSYLVPIYESDGGAAQVKWGDLFKVGPGPNSDKSWTVTSSGTAVDLLSNIGGARFNVGNSSRFQFFPPVEGVEIEATATAAFTGGTDLALKRAIVFEGLDTAKAQEDFFAGKLGNYPAALIVWNASVPIEGRSSGVRRGSARPSRVTSLFREEMTIYIVTSRVGSDAQRRDLGLALLEDCSLALTDTMRNRDGEVLAVTGNGLQVLARGRAARSPNSYIYKLDLRASSSLTKCDERTFDAWLTTRYRDQIPADGPLAETDRVDITESMT